MKLILQQKPNNKKENQLQCSKKDNDISNNNINNRQRNQIQEQPQLRQEQAFCDIKENNNNNSKLYHIFDCDF